MHKRKKDKKNAEHYNQMLAGLKKKKNSRKKNSKKKTSFSSQTINLKDYLFIPEGMEFFFYTFYLMVVPYITGAIFLFFAVAGGDFNNFMLLDLAQAFIVWAIGYEIVATISLLWIAVLFIKYDSEE